MIEDVRQHDSHCRIVSPKTRYQWRITGMYRGWAWMIDKHGMKHTRTVGELAGYFISGHYSYRPFYRLTAEGTLEWLS